MRASCAVVSGPAYARLACRGWRATCHAAKGEAGARRAPVPHCIRLLSKRVEWGSRALGLHAMGSRGQGVARGRIARYTYMKLRRVASSAACSPTHSAHLQGEHWLGAMADHCVSEMSAQADRKRLLLERFQLEVPLTRLSAAAALLCPCTPRPTMHEHLLISRDGYFCNDAPQARSADHADPNFPACGIAHSDSDGNVRSDSSFARGH